VNRKRQKSDIVIMDLEKLNTYNAQGCLACGRKFNLGDPVVLACGSWSDRFMYIHAHEAVLDRESNCYFEKGHHRTLR